MSLNIEQLKKKLRLLEATNKNALYDSHIYWSQKPYNVCDLLIESLSSPGDVVFDPFLGSGVTILEAIKKKYQRIGIGCEINDVPLFIVRTLLSEIDTAEYEAESEKTIQELKSLQKYYSTKCPYCHKDGIITSVVFDKPTRQADPDITVINYRCDCGSKRTKSSEPDDLLNMTKNYPVYNIKNEILVPNSKLAVYENQPISQIFTPRNFKVLDELIGQIEQKKYKNIFKYILMSVLHLCKITDKHSNSQWPLWIPKTGCVEKNVLDLFEKKIKKFGTAIKYISANYDNPSYKLIQKGSQFITEDDIANETVQLIITDPPYLGQVAYSEYMQLYRPFFNFDYNFEDEIVVSSAPSRNKTEEMYFDLLDKVFGICSDKLKNHAYFCMYFHDCSLTVWNKIVSSLANHHLRYISQIHISKSNTLKNIISPKKSLNGDCILFFIKDEGTRINDGTESIDEIEKNIIIQTKALIRQHGAMSTPELYDNGLMEILIQNGWLSKLSQKYKSLVDIFEKHLSWDSDTARWK